MLTANNKKKTEPPTKNDKTVLESSFSFCLIFQILWLPSKSNQNLRIPDHINCEIMSVVLNYQILQQFFLDSLHSRSKVRHESFCISNKLPGKIDFMLLNITSLPSPFSLLQLCTKPLLTLPFCLNPITPFFPNIKWFPLPAM